MTNKQVIAKYIGTVKTKQILSGTTDDQVILINNQYIIKTMKTNPLPCAEWYLNNPSISPELIYSDDKTLLYKYETNSGDQIKVQVIIELIKNYNPHQSESNIDLYQQTLVDLYLRNCHELALAKHPLANFPPLPMYELHGDMGVHNLILSNRIIIIDPEPITGYREQDILQLWLSSPKLINLLPISKLKEYCNCEAVDFLLPILLADRIARAKRHHPVDLNFYIELYNSL